MLIYESGTIGAKPGRLPLSIGDGILAETADAVVSVPEIFNYWLQPGRIDVGLSRRRPDRPVRQHQHHRDRPDYDDPKVRLPGAGGAPEIAASCREVIVVVRQSPRGRSSSGWTSSPRSASARVPATGERLGLTGAGPRKVITDLGILEPDPQTCELTLTGVFPGVDVTDVTAKTGWNLAVSDSVAVLPPPSQAELTALRALQATIPAPGGAA